MIIEVDDDTEIEFPDDTDPDVIKKILADRFPPKPADIAAQIKADPDFVPTQEQYAKFENWKDENQKGLFASFVEAVPEMVGQVGSGLMGIADISRWKSITSPFATIGEAAGQGTMQLYQLIAESQNPKSPAFNLKNLIFNDGSVKDRYDQFIQAREFAKTVNAAASGETPAIPGAEKNADPETAANLSILIDPTLMLGPVKGLAMTGKLGQKAIKAAEAVNSIESLAGKISAKAVSAGADAVSATGKAVSGVIEGAVRKAGEAISHVKIPGAPAIGAAAGLGAAHIPGIGTAAGIYGGAKAAQIGGELIGEAARTAPGPASRLSTLEQLAASPTLSVGARNTATALLPLDPAFRLGGAMARGGMEGAAVGGALGYYGTGTAEGAGSGAGAGFGLGSVGGAVGKGIERLAGVGRKDAIANEVIKEISTLTTDQQPLAAKTFGKMMDRGQHEGVAELIDVRRWLGNSIDFRYIDNVTAPEVFAKQFPGQKYVHSQGFAGMTEAGKPAVFINADNVKPGTAYHEALHGAVRSAIGVEFGQKMADWAQANLSEPKIREYIGEYLSRASVKDRPRLQAALDTATPDGLRTVLEEVSADSFSRFLRSSEHRDYLLRGKRDLGGIMVGLAKDTIGQLTDRLGKTDYGTQRGFEKIAKELINAQRIIARQEIKSGPAKRPVDLSNLSGKDLEAWAAKHGQVDTLQRDANGNTTGVKSEVEVEAAREKVNAAIFSQMHEHAVKAGASKATDSSIKVNRRMLEKYKGTIPPELYKRAAALLDAKDQGLVVKWDTYFPENKKLSKSNTSIVVNRQAESRSGVPFELSLYKKGGLKVTILDYDKIMARADDYLGREGMLKPWNGSKMDALADLRRYINNLGSEDSVPSVKLLGSKEKRDILYKIVGSRPRKTKPVTVFENEPSIRNSDAEHQAGTGLTIGQLGAGNNTTPTVSLRLDRMGEHGPSGDKLGWTAGAYYKSQINWNPAQVIGETEVITSKEGFKIIHGQKWRLYDKSEKLIGIYGSEGEAIKKAEKVPIKDPITTKERVITYIDEMLSENGIHLPKNIPDNYIGDTISPRDILSDLRRSASGGVGSIQSTAKDASHYFGINEEWNDFINDIRMVSGLPDLRAGTREASRIKEQREYRESL